MLSPKLRSFILRTSLFSIALTFIAAAAIWSVANKQVMDRTHTTGELLAAQLSVEANQVLFANDLLSLQGLIQKYLTFSDAISSIKITDIDGQLLVSSGTPARGLAFTHEIISGRDTLGQVTLFLTPEKFGNAWVSVLICTLSIIIISTCIILIFIRFIAQHKPAPQNGTLVTIELTDLPELASHISRHTLDNIYDHFQTDVTKVLDAAGGILYPGNGPILRGLFTGPHADQSALIAALLIKRLSRCWGVKNGFKVHRKIVVQHAQGLNDSGALTDNQHRAQQHIETRHWFKRSEAGDIVLAPGLSCTPPEGVDYQHLEGAIKIIGTTEHLKDQLDDQLKTLECWSVNSNNN